MLILFISVAATPAIAWSLLLNSGIEMSFSCSQLYKLHKMYSRNDRFIDRIFGEESGDNQSQIPGLPTRNEIFEARSKQHCPAYEIYPAMYTGFALVILGVVLYFLRKSTWLAIFAIAAGVLLTGYTYATYVIGSAVRGLGIGIFR